MDSNSNSSFLEAASPTATAAPSPSSSTGSTRYQVSAWDLSDLLPEPTEAVIRQRLEDIEQKVADFESWRGRLAPDMSPAELLEAVKDYEQILDRTDVLGGYASLWFASDTQSSETIGFRNRARQVLTRLHNRFLFFSLWWKSLNPVQAEALLPKGEENADYRHFLNELRRFTPYSLNEESEQIINSKNANGIDAVITLYSMITNRMEFNVEENGETLRVTEEEMRSRFFSTDPQVRETTYKELFRVYKRDSNLLAQIYATRSRDWHSEYSEIRGFSSPIAVRNLNNDISDAAVDTMLDVVRQNAPVFQDYFRLKGQWLGITPLRRYDIYAPLAASTQIIDFADAVDSVLTTFRSFNVYFAELAERVFKENHIDSEIRKGKRSGAFCATILPRHTPWVLTNYTGRVRDVATLAHELGHAVHSMLAEHHSLLTQHPPLPLAETASVFSEILMTDRMLSQTHDPVARRELLASAVDDIYATVMRQTFFVCFEREAHAAIAAGRPVDDLFDLYQANLRQQFGDEMEIDDDFRFEWLSIPHIYNTPFYCYSYSFGQLLVLALYRRYQQEGDAFVPGYMRLLSYGGSKAPAEALAELNIDIADPAFWQGGFDVVRDMIEELKTLDMAS